MSQVRTTHPGYYGILMAISVTWYVGLGLTFIFQGDQLGQIQSYRLVMHYVSATAWGCTYLAIGLAIIVCANVKRIPHHYVRVFVLCGWLITIFFLITFIAYDVIHGVPPATLIPAFASMALVEYRALVEAERNPSMIARRAWRAENKRRRMWPPWSG